MNIRIATADELATAFLEGQDPKGYTTVFMIRLDKYRSNDAVAVLAFVRYPDGDREWSKVSKNLDHGQPLQSKDLEDGEFFADMDDMIVAMLVRAGWVALTGQTGVSGYKTYNVCRLTDKAIMEPPENAKPETGE